MTFLFVYLTIFNVDCFFFYLFISSFLSGDNDTLRRCTFYEACCPRWTISEGLPGDGHDAEGTFRLLEASIRRKVRDIITEIFY